MTKDYDIQSETLNKFFSNGTKIIFHIPNYQRNYSWQKQHVEEFFNDVYDQIGSKSQHYFGMMMTLKKPSHIPINEFELIDGQQRIITSIIFLVCIRDIFHELNSDMAENINSEIFNNDDENDEQRYKITHDGWTESFFRKVLSNLPNVDNEFFYGMRKEIPKNIYQSFYKNGKTPKNQLSKFSKVKISNEADKLLMKAYITIRKEIARRIIEQLNDLNINYKLKTTNDYKEFVIKFLCKLHDTLMENSMLSNITVDHESKVYSIFNGINNRGLKLAMSDTVKNWILHHIYEENAKVGTKPSKEVIQRWKDMEKKTTKKKLDNYIHHYLITYHSKIDGEFHYIKKLNSFSTIKNVLKSYESQADLKATKLLKKISNKFHDYNLLIDPDSIYDDLNDPNTQSTINEEAADCLFWIHKLQSVIVYPVLMAGHEKYTKKDFTTLTHIILKWFFVNRTVNKREAQQLEKELAGITYNIMNSSAKEQFNVNDVRKELLKSTKMDDFLNKISTIELNEVASTYFLTILEYKKPKKIINNTLEHIMPKKGIDAWLEYIQETNPELKDDPKEIHKEYKNRLGNLTLLEKRLNKKLKAELFLTKRDGTDNNKNKECSYRESRIRITLDICNEPNDYWTIERIKARQLDFVEQAETLWQI